jgi:hypothetical protein
VRPPDLFTNVLLDNRQAFKTILTVLLVVLRSCKNQQQKILDAVFGNGLIMIAGI